MPLMSQSLERQDASNPKRVSNHGCQCRSAGTVAAAARHVALARRSTRLIVRGPRHGGRNGAQPGVAVPAGTAGGIADAAAARAAVAAPRGAVLRRRDRDLRAGGARLDSLSHHHHPSPRAAFSGLLSAVMSLLLSRQCPVMPADPCPSTSLRNNLHAHACHRSLGGSGLTNLPMLKKDCDRARLQVHTADSFSPRWSSSGPIALPGSEQGLSVTPIDVAATAAGGLRVLLRVAGVDDLRVVNVNADASGAFLSSGRCVCSCVRPVHTAASTRWRLLHHGCRVQPPDIMHPQATPQAGVILQQRIPLTVACRERNARHPAA